MGRFNSQKAPSRAVLGGDTVNLAGGQAFSLDVRKEIATIVLTSLLNDQFYRSVNSTVNRLIQLISADPLFAAKAAVYARNVFGTRSITHVVAGEIGHRVSGKDWTSPFFGSVIRRPDDMSEIMAYFSSRYAKTRLRSKDGKKVYRGFPNAMKRGFGKALGNFDSYQLAKYRGEGKEFNLYDVVNLVRPIPTEKNKEALYALMNGKLTSTDTWESKLTKAGQAAQNADELLDLKSAAWKELIETRKLGYMALLKNLRNINAQAPDVMDKAIEMLTDERLIRKSLVLPFRYFIAYNQLKSVLPRTVLQGLSNALNISCSNVPKFPGKTLIVLDDSGSMTGARINGGKSSEPMSCATVGSLLTSVILNSNPDADVVMFNSSARYVHVPVDSGVISTTTWVESKIHGGGTNFNSIFRVLNKAYDRIILLSDMQGWMEISSPSGRGGSFQTYKKSYNCDPYLYTIDLAGYGTSQFDPDNPKVFILAGFSEKIFDVMKHLENDPNALVSEIEKIRFNG